jgi:hypothetical protein
MWSSETCMILWRKTPRTFGRGMTLRYSRGEGFWWMRLASRTGRSYRLVTVFSLITVSKQKSVSKQKPSKTTYHMDYMWSSETCMILWRKTPRTFGRGMTLRYSRGEGWGWMRLVSRTGRSYRLVTVFSLIWFLLSLVTPLTKKTKSVLCLYRIYTYVLYTNEIPSTSYFS